MTTNNTVSSDVHLSCYVITEDDWAGSYGLAEGVKDAISEKLVNISLYGNHDFSHIESNLFESILDDYDEYETEDELNRDHGIWKWFINASGNDDMALEKKFDSYDDALKAFTELLAKDKVDFEDFTALNGESC